MANYLLTKSSFVRGVQCQKSLYLYKNNYKERDAVSHSQQAIFNRGTNVGILARQLFPNGIDVTPESIYKYEDSAKLTQELIAAGKEIIYEAAFIYDDTLVAVDILVKENGHWKALEVKSSVSISETYLMDAALQHYVIKGSGLPLEDFKIVYVNRDYFLHGAINLKQLFIQESVKKYVENKSIFIQEQIQHSKATLSKANIPNINIGEHCFQPYNCDFMGTCWKNIPDNSVFDIGGMRKDKMFDLYNKRYIRMADIPSDLDLAAAFKIQIEANKKNEVIIDREAIADFLKTLHYPLYFLDFESFMPAVPIYQGSHPYEHIPFQYSLHHKATKDGELTHKEFLAETGIDPRKIFAERLLNDTKEKGDILVYNKDFEKKIMKDLGHDFPEYRDALRERISRIKDIAIPFAKKFYYSQTMHGSHSLKAVLPALVPDLKYEELIIKDGNTASISFERLQTETDLIKMMETRDNLIEYCKMDTLAMVRILEVLEAIIPLS
jgi:hypothetical protein